MVAKNAALQIENTVPWAFTHSGDFLQWLWVTKDFEAIVEQDGGKWKWKVTTPTGIRLGVGGGSDFDTCEDFALETIGKAFPREAGWTKYTKNSTSKYTISNGIRTNFADANGKIVKVTLTDGTRIGGRLLLGEWYLNLETKTAEDEDPVLYEIDPAQVVSIGIDKWAGVVNG